MSMVAASRRMGRSTPGTGCWLCPSSKSRIAFHHLCRIVARRSTSSGCSALIEGCFIVPRRNGSNSDWTWVIRCAICLNVKPLNSSSNVLKDDQRVSRIWGGISLDESSVIGVELLSLLVDCEVRLVMLRGPSCWTLVAEDVSELASS